MKILVVEDEAKVCDLLVKGLREARYAVDSVSTGTDALALARAYAYDLIVLDLMLPGLDGMEVLKSLRDGGSRVPVIVLSAKEALEDRLQALRQGGDDYILKPFSFAELLVRIEAVLRRANAATTSSVLTYGDLSMHLLLHEVRRGPERIELQPREFRLLEYFLRNPEQALTKTLILEKIWDYQFDPQTNVVDVLVCRLRSKVDRGFGTRLIQTVRGVGYALKRH